MRLLFVSLAALMLVWSVWTISIEVARPGLRNIASRFEHGDPAREIDVGSGTFRDAVRTLAESCRDAPVREAVTLTLGRLARGLEAAGKDEADALYREAAAETERYLACTPTNGDIWFQYARLLNHIGDDRAGPALAASAEHFPFEQRTLVNRIRFYTEFAKEKPAKETRLAAARIQDLRTAVRYLDVRTIGREFGK
jgi:hypothetical protein